MSIKMEADVVVVAAGDETCLADDAGDLPKGFEGGRDGRFDAFRRGPPVHLVKRLFERLGHALERVRRGAHEI